MKFYLCEVCGNLVGMIHDSGVVPVCCKQNMTELTTNTVEASNEKHLPVVTVESDPNGTRVKVDVGSVAHPMIEAHLINWIYIETTKGGHRANLKAGDAPVAHYHLVKGEELIAAYAYCNLHGLWKTSV